MFLTKVKPSSLYFIILIVTKQLQMNKIESKTLLNNPGKQRLVITGHKLELFIQNIRGKVEAPVVNIGSNKNSNQSVSNPPVIFINDYYYYSYSKI